MEDEFLERVHGIVQCTAATVDTKGRPRSRIWHPIWEGKTGRIANNRTTLKTRHLARNPYLSLCYLDQGDPWRPRETRLRRLPRRVGRYGRGQTQDVGDVRARTQPLGYDPARIWGGVENPEFGVLVLRPWRVELVDGPGESRVWRA